MDCVPSVRAQYRYSHCPAEVLGALRNQACRLCGGKEAQLRVPRTKIHIPTVPLADVINKTTGAGLTKVVVPCPAGFHGHVVRSCTKEGWLDETPLAGPGCVRKRCLALEISLNSTAVSNEIISSSTGGIGSGGTSLGHTATDSTTSVILATSLEGTSRVSKPCPKGYSGSVSAVCPEDADQWTDLRIHCEPDP